MPPMSECDTLWAARNACTTQTQPDGAQQRAQDKRIVHDPGPSDTAPDGLGDLAFRTKRLRQNLKNAAQATATGGGST